MKDKDQSSKTKFARIDITQHCTIKKVAKERGITFQFLLNKIIQVGINIMRLEK
jgi:hypothetical protein